MRKFLISFCVSLFFVVNFALPSYALDSATVFCGQAQNAQACASLGGAANILPNVAAPIVPASRAVPVVAEVLNASGQVIATTYNGTVTVAGTSKVVAGLTAAGGFVLGAVTVSSLNSLRDTARSNYCSANPSACSAGPIAAYGQGINSNCSGMANWGTANYPAGTTWANGFHPTFTSCPALIFTLPSGTKSYFHPTGVQITVTQIEYSNLTQAQRDAASRTLTPSQVTGALTSPQVISPIAIPPGGRVRVTAGNDDAVFITPDGIDVYPFAWDAPSNDLDGDGITDDADTDVDGDGIPDEFDPDDDNDNVPDDLEADGDIPDINLDVECVECDPAFSDAVNFVAYAIEVSSDKFPFDLLGDTSVLQENAFSQCPRYEFWNDEHEVCFVRDLFVGMKYSVWTSFIVRLIFHV